LSPERICVIVNPLAGRGRGAKLVPAISAAFAGAAVRISETKGDERRLAREAIGEGFTTLVAVGGDGTTANIANAILHSGGGARLAVMPAGTGNDFAKLLGTHKSGAPEIARLCSDADDLRVDAGRIEDVFFLNACGFGFDVAVVEGIERTPWLTGNSVYIYTAMRQLFGYRGLEAATSSILGQRPRALHLLLVFANAENFGGAFRIAPGASVSDGKLDAVSILDIGPLRRITMLSAATRGEHIHYGECRVERAPEFDATFDEAPAYEADGELYRAKSATVRISSCPSALRVVATTEARSRLANSQPPHNPP